MTALDTTTNIAPTARVTTEQLLSDTSTMNLCRNAGIVEFRDIGSAIWELVGTQYAVAEVREKDGAIKAQSEARRPFFAIVLPGNKGMFTENGGLIVLLREGQEKADRLKVWEDLARHYDAICQQHPTLRPALDTYLAGDYGGTVKVITIGGKP